jgi:serine/threonine-protein kinase
MTSLSRFGPYEILGRLGAGGMGEVYRARDPRLGRDVAVKILAAERADDSEAVARLLREARTVAALQHPSIVTIHDVGQESGRVFLVTEVLDGGTLRERLGRGPLSTREALDHAVAIASALAAAHDHGVVHRDLKPENVMATSAGALKVVDFGLAKSVARADGPTAIASVVTEPGATVGTPAYMAPEQLEGRAVDHRADQFAFGVMLFELLAGQRPFKGGTAAEAAASILRDDPPHLASVRADVPSTLSRIVARCLAKDPQDRYASTTDLVHALSDARADLGVTTPPAAMVQSGPRRSRGRRAAAVVTLTLVALAAAIFMWQRGARGVFETSADAPRTIAVLPFTNIGGEDAYLADGITEAVTRELGHIDGVRVIAANSAFAYRGRTDGLIDIARELGASVIVRGSAQRAGERVRINASLVNAADGASLWSNQYNRAANDVLAVQDDIAWQVAASLAGALGAAPPSRPADTPTTNAEAYDAYLRGLSHMRGHSSGFDKGIVELERAVSFDPNFALAYARLASAYTQQFFYNATDPELERRAFIAIEKALAINPDLADAYLARAQLMWNLRNGFPHERTIEDLRRAVALNPNLAEAHIELGKLYYHVGLIDAAVAANQQALRLDPRSTVARNRFVAAMVDGGMTNAIADELARNPQWSLRSRSGALSFLGRTDEAIQALAPDGFSHERLRTLDMNDAALLAQLLARVGRHSDARRALVIAIPLAANPTGLSDTHHAQFAIGCAYAQLGEHDRAVEWVTKAANEGYPSYPRFSREPDLEPLRNHPGFKTLLERLRVDHERWRATFGVR